MINGSCSAVSGTPRTLSKAISFTQPIGMNNTSFLTFAELAFMSSLGFQPTCSAGGVSSVSTIQVTPEPISISPGGVSYISTILVPSTISISTIGSLTNISSLLTTSVTSTASSSSTLTTTTFGINAKLGIGLGIPIGVLAPLLLGLYLWHKRLGNKQRSAAQEIDSEDKAEMEAHRLGHELPGESMNAEIDTNGERLELPVEKRSQELSPGAPRQELSGGEFAREMEAHLDAIKFRIVDRDTG